MAALNEISPANLMRLIGTPQCPVLIDVCIDPDFADDPYLIPTAQRHPHTDVDGIVARSAGKQTIVICQKGLKLSHGVAARLRNRSIDAQALEGGNIAWKNAQLPRVPAAKVPGSLWVTRHRPKIDRIACPWLIRRFVDPFAEFMFVPPAQVIDVADRFDATSFDITDTHWGHRDDKCTFDTMLDEFALHTPALDTLATVVRAADTNQHALAPQAAGLLAISVGLSRMYRNDDAQLIAGMEIYDALYRWARDAQDETHDF
ncbi:chromate resistance protein ChrB domain-containing protein [Yoonia maritima]|uniref:chromate resistance protein ChrB domain-containing protein n=1 Tax=Yoonia maritima TaxID=1435347 RepID=UPI00373529C5